MIVMTYQGVGKTTLCEGERLSSSFREFIDFESGLFKRENGTRCEDWASTYVKCAESLSKQGFTPLISSHSVVQMALNSVKEPVLSIFPSKNLKDQWISKLRKRWIESKSDKDYRAYINAATGFDDQIDILRCSPFEKIEIEDMDYKLWDLIWAHKLKMSFDRQKKRDKLENEWDISHSRDENRDPIEEETE